MPEPQSREHGVIVHVHRVHVAREPERLRIEHLGVGDEPVAVALAHGAQVFVGLPISRL